MTRYVYEVVWRNQRGQDKAEHVVADSVEQVVALGRGARDRGWRLAAIRETWTVSVLLEQGLDAPPLHPDHETNPGVDLQV